MQRLITVSLGLGVAAAIAACGPRAGTLDGAAAALSTSTLQSLEFSGSGRWFQFGQAPSPTLPWPQFDVSAYTAAINFETAGARVRMTRIQTVEPGRARPTPATQSPEQLVSGTFAWNMAVPGGSPAGTPPAAQPNPAAVEERLMEIWSTPQGFVKAAIANNATVQPAGGGSTVTFTAAGHRYEGTINAQNLVERVRTWIDNPILGDTLVDTQFSEYRDFGGIQFPARIARSQGGHPVLDLTVATVTANPAVDIAVPATVRNFSPPAVVAQAERLAPGVFYITGGSHHSVAIDQADHIVVVEGPQGEARSLAVIAKVKETIPNKPIRFLVNSHVHFDHSGGLRTWVDEGATIVTHELNQPYYEQAWAAGRTLNPDRLAKSQKAAQFQTFGAEPLVLTDGKRTIAVHSIAGNGHNDAFAMVYLPAEKILVEVDAYAPPAANAPMPAVPSPFAVNLHDNILRLKLDVRQIAPLHGRVATMAELRSFIGLGAAAKK